MKKLGRLGKLLKLPTLLSLWLYFCISNRISISGGFNGNKTTRKEEITVKEGFILQHVDGSGLSGSGDYGIDRRSKDAPVIRELLDEALGARRRKALGISDSEEPPGQGTAETLHTIQTLLLRLIKREELLLRNQRVGTQASTRNLCRSAHRQGLAWEELIERPLMQKGRTKQALTNYFDMKTRYAKEHAIEFWNRKSKEGRSRECR